MGRLHGKDGSVTFATGYVLHCTSWDVDRTLETADGTEKGSVNRTADAGLKAATFKWTCFLDSASPLIDVGAEGSATFKFDSGGTRKLDAKILVTSKSVSGGLGDLWSVNYTAQIGGTTATGAATDYVIS